MIKIISYLWRRVRWLMSRCRLPMMSRMCTLSPSAPSNDLQFHSNTFPNEAPCYSKSPDIWGLNACTRALICSLVLL